MSDNKSTKTYTYAFPGPGVRAAQEDLMAAGFSAERSPKNKYLLVSNATPDEFRKVVKDYHDGVDGKILTIPESKCGDLKNIKDMAFRIYGSYRSQFLLEVPDDEWTDALVGHEKDIDEDYKKYRVFSRGLGAEPGEKQKIYTRVEDLRMPEEQR